MKNSFKSWIADIPEDEVVRAVDSYDATLKTLRKALETLVGLCWENESTDQNKEVGATIRALQRAIAKAEGKI